MSDVQAALRCSPIGCLVEGGCQPRFRRLLLWLAAWLLLIGTAPNLPAQSNTLLQRPASYGVEVWDTDRGLPQSFVFALSQSREGYLWLGTYNGLVRFDGMRFTVFDENNTPALGSSRIVTLFEDAQTNLWIGTEAAGIVLLKDGQITNPGIGKGRKTGFLGGIGADTNGVVWLYTGDGQLWRYEGGPGGRALPSVTNYAVGPWRGLVVEQSGLLWLWSDNRQIALRVPAKASQPVLEQNLVAGKLDYLLPSRQGGIWRLSDGRIQKWNNKAPERDLGNYPWGSARIKTACEDLAGNLVVGTSGAGVYWFDAQGQAACLSTNTGLSSSYILSLQMDREANLWVGTDGGGLNRVKRQVFELLPETSGLVVQSVCPDDQNGLWIGFNMFDSAANAIGYLRTNQVQSFRSPNTTVNSVYVDRQHRVWAGAYRGLYQLEKGIFVPVPVPVPGLNVGRQQVSAIYQDRQARIWAGTGGGLACLDEQGWKNFDTRNGLSANAVTALAEDSQGNLWIGTMGGGLNRFRDGQFSAERKSKDGLPSDDISSLWIDAQDVIWVGTFGTGLARLHKGKWTSFTTREGLVSNGIGYIIEDDQGYLWIGSNMGLMRVEKSALNNFARGATTFVPCRTYGKADGLPTAQCTPGGTQPGACRTRDGKFWFPTIKGLVSVNPAELHPNPFPPAVVIESVSVDGQILNTNGLAAGHLIKVVVPARRERLEIQFTSLSLTAPDKARFRFRLEPHESGWNNVGSNTREARYPKLPPGTYQFHVSACNEDGVWNQSGSRLEIVVLPPFWRTWWFLTAVSVSLLGTIVSVVHYISTQRLQREVEKLHQQEILQQERTRIARDLHDQLGASLTQVALLGELVESDKEAPKEVEAHAQQISQTARETTRVLDEIVWAVNPSNDTLEGLVNYVCKHTQEYLAVAGLRYRLDIPSQLPATPLPPEVRHNVFLASKEAVTNVVRHAKASSAWIRLKLEPGRFTLEIADDGRGLGGLDPQAAAKRNGLKNMRKRMEDIGGEFFIGPAPEGGAVVRLIAPLASS